MEERIIGKTEGYKIYTHGGKWRTGRSCMSTDSFFVKEGIQCGNCGAVLRDGKVIATPK